MVQLIAREVAAANVGLEIQVFPGSSLYKPNDQWNAVTRGLLDMTSFPLDYASGRHPEFSATLMPGLVGNFDRAMRLNDSEFMGDIKKVIENAGALVIADAWLSGAFASKKNCITSPDTIKGQVIRAAGPAFEEMLVEAGASISSMPSSEIYTGMQRASWMRRTPRRRVSSPIACSNRPSASRRREKMPSGSCTNRCWYRSASSMA